MGKWATQDPKVRVMSRIWVLEMRLEDKNVKGRRMVNIFLL